MFARGFSPRLACELVPGLRTGPRLSGTCRCECPSQEAFLSRGPQVVAVAWQLVYLSPRRAVKISRGAETLAEAEGCSSFLMAGWGKDPRIWEVPGQSPSCKPRPNRAPPTHRDSSPSAQPARAPPTHRGGIHLQTPGPRPHPSSHSPLPTGVSCWPGCGCRRGGWRRLPRRPRVLQRTRQTTSCSQQGLQAVPADIPAASRESSCTATETAYVPAAAGFRACRNLTILWLHSNAGLTSRGRLSPRPTASWSSAGLSDNAAVAVDPALAARAWGRPHAAPGPPCLRELGPACSGGLAALQYLYLQDNGLQALPDDAFSDLGNLTHLFLHGTASPAPGARPSAACDSLTAFCCTRITWRCYAPATLPGDLAAS